jgi:hypothetical protein
MDAAMTPEISRHPLRGFQPIAAAASRGEDGFTLAEVLVALLITIAIAIGILSMDVLATKVTENEGHLSARTTEYAQDKIEQLLLLAYGNTTTDTTVFPATDTGGTGLAIGGSSNPGAPVAGYVDYLAQDGTLLASGGGAPANWYYKRVWSISSPGTNLKLISVTVAIRSAYAAGHAQQSTVAALKSFPF